MLDKTATNWQEAADGLEIEGRAFINGQMTDALSGKTRPSINPATSAKLADIANCGSENKTISVLRFGVNIRNPQVHVPLH